MFRASLQGPTCSRLLVLAALVSSVGPLLGCGQPGRAAPAGAVTVPVISPNGRTDYTALGDSITCGYVAAGANTSPPYSIGDASCHTANAFPSYMAASLGVPLHNLAIPADQACDLWVRQIAPQSLSPSSATAPLYTVLIGTNDAGAKGAGAYEADFRACGLAALTWLSLPLQSKVLAASAIRDGWSLGMSASLGTYALAVSPGATLTFTVTTSGGPLYLWHTISDTDAGSASFAVDQTTLGSFATAPVVPVATQNGTHNAVVAERITGVPAGTHTVVITDLVGDVAVIGLGTPSTTLPPNHPIVLAGAVPAPLQGVGDYRLAANAAYTADTAALAATLHADGLDVRFAPNAQYLTGAADELTDVVHLSPLGATHLAEAFLAAGP